MAKKKVTLRRGFTLMELVVVMVSVVIVVLALSIALADGVRGWHIMYNRVYSDVVTDSYVARKRFDAMIRKASAKNLLLDDAGSWIEVCYYADGDSVVVDRYARFYPAGGELKLEYGSLEPREALGTHTVCLNVSSCVFTRDGRSAQMILTLDNGSQTATVVSSGVMHN